MPRIPIKDPLLESRLFLRRTVAALLISTVLVLALVARLVYLQVIAHDHFTTLSRNNRVKILPVPPTRGLIYDRNGVLLAENLPSYRLEIIPEQVQNMDRTLDALSKIIEIRPEDRKRFERLLSQTHRFDGIPLRFHLSDEEVARFAVNRQRFPGVDIQAGLSRFYPLGRHAVHVVGYVGRIDESELKQVDYANYRGTNHIGKVGVEKTYESVLHGTVGYQQVETNAQGRIIRVLEETPPVPGRNIYLSLDIKVQEVAEQAMADHDGAVVAINPENGDILAMVSQPGYDPNLFVNGIDAKEYNALKDNPDQPLFNRVLRGQYPPGSTIKPFVGLGGLEDGVTTASATTFCPGYYQLPGSEHKYRDWKRWGHGIVDINKAIEQSCDVYFYDLANSMGIDRLHDYLAQFGFGRRTGVDLPGELPGLLPSREWKRRTRNEPWFPGETLIAGIGQGFDLATPLQLAMATGELATYGRRVVPHVVVATQDPVTGKMTPVPPHVLSPIPIVNRAHWTDIINAMQEVVDSVHGTAHRIAKGLTYTVAGKTGTAQVFGLKQEEKYDPAKLAEKLRDHALFIAFAPVDKPRIAVAVVVENGGGGGSVAAPIAREVMDQYLLGKTQ